MRTPTPPPFHFFANHRTQAQKLFGIPSRTWNPRCDCVGCSVTPDGIDSHVVMRLVLGSLVFSDLLNHVVITRFMNDSVEHMHFSSDVLMWLSLSVSAVHAHRRDM